MMLHRCRMDILRHECLMLCVCRLPTGSCCEAVQQYIGQQWAQPTSPAKTLHRVVKADAPIEKAKNVDQLLACTWMPSATSGTLHAKLPLDISASSLYWYASFADKPQQ